MDVQKLIAPKISDPLALEEFVESLNDLVPGIERDVAKLRHLPGDRETIGDLFRAVHNIKGDATLCRVDFAILIVHPIETVLARFRNGEVTFSDMLAESLLLTLDRLELAVEALQANKPVAHLKLVELVHGLEAMAMAAPADLDSAACDMIEAVTGFRPAVEAARLSRGPAPTYITRSTAQVGEDLRFFRSLAEQFEARSPLFKGRTMRLLRLAAETNQLGSKSVDPAQLEAAIYMHDIGMMCLPESVWLKVERMSDEDKKQLRHHPTHAAGLLARMSGWEEAARIVAQHHEMPDGKGYPEGLTGDAICDGAKIIAIVDAFEAVMLKHINRGKTRSVLRAIAEINACDKQFAPEWIEPFNRVIQRSMEK